jgi:hypothetical protein
VTIDDEDTWWSGPLARTIGCHGLGAVEKGEAV